MESVTLGIGYKLLGRDYWPLVTRVNEINGE